MNRQQFSDFLQSPDNLSGENISILAEIISQFPYCQTAHLLYLKGLHLDNNIHYEQQLKVAAAYSSDRKKLYELVMQPALTFKISKIEETTALPKNKEETPTISELEKQILKEAVNATIQIEVSKTKEQKVEKQVPLTSEKKARKAKKTETLNKEHTFNEWLKIIKKSKQTGGWEKGNQKAQSKELIDRFLEENPQPIAPKTEFFSPVNTARLSIIEDETFVTETLAEIYVKQKHYAKAIKAYEILSLNYPEKIRTFAARIKSVRELMKKE